MDNRTRDKLQKMGDRVFFEEIKPNIIREDTFAEQRESTKRLSKKVLGEKKRQLEIILQDPRLYQKTENIDPKAEERAEKKMEAMIKRAIKKGDIPPPKKDEFMRRLEQRRGDASVKEDYYRKHNREMQERFGK